MRVAVPTDSDPVGSIQEVPQLDRLPVFVRAGSIIPSQPLVQSTSETPRGPLTLDVYPGANCLGTLYADDGTSMGFERGQYFRQAITCTEVSPGRLEISFGSPEGKYKPWWRNLAVVVHGWTGTGAVRAGSNVVQARPDAAAATLTFDLPAGQARGTVIVTGG
jgi:alpha-glucosidase